MIKLETQIHTTICIFFLNGRYHLSYRGLDGIIILKHALNKNGWEIWKERYQTAKKFCNAIELQIPYMPFNIFFNNLCVKVKCYKLYKKCNTVSQNVI
jgi:hypothetical protein